MYLYTYFTSAYLIAGVVAVVFGAVDRVLLGSYSDV